MADNYDPKTPEKSGSSAIRNLFRKNKEVNNMYNEEEKEQKDQENQILNSEQDKPELTNDNIAGSDKNKPEPANYKTEGSEQEKLEAPMDKKPQENQISDASDYSSDELGRKNDRSSSESEQLYDDDDFELDELPAAPKKERFAKLKAGWNKLINVLKQQPEDDEDEDTDDDLISSDYSDAAELDSVKQNYKQNRRRYTEPEEDPSSNIRLPDKSRIVLRSSTADQPSEFEDTPDIPQPDVNPAPVQEYKQPEIKITRPAPVNPQPANKPVSDTKPVQETASAVNVQTETKPVSDTKPIQETASAVNVQTEEKQAIYADGDEYDMSNLIYSAPRKKPEPAPATAAPAPAPEPKTNYRELPMFDIFTEYAKAHTADKPADTADKQDNAETEKTASAEERPAPPEGRASDRPRNKIPPYPRRNSVFIYDDNDKTEAPAAGKTPQESSSAVSAGETKAENKPSSRDTAPANGRNPVFIYDDNDKFEPSAAGKSLKDSSAASARRAAAVNKPVSSRNNAPANGRNSVFIYDDNHKAETSSAGKTSQKSTSAVSAGETKTENKPISFRDTAPSEPADVKLHGKEGKGPAEKAENDPKFMPFDPATSVMLDPQSSVMMDEQRPAEPEKPQTEPDLSESSFPQVSYHYSTAQPFIVMAGKFSRTVRTEYEAARLSRMKKAAAAAEKSGIPAPESAAASHQNKKPASIPAEQNPAKSQNEKPRISDTKQRPEKPIALVPAPKPVSGTNDKSPSSKHGTVTPLSKPASKSGAEGPAPAKISEAKPASSGTKPLRSFSEAEPIVKHVKKRKPQPENTSANTKATLSSEIGIGSDARIDEKPVKEKSGNSRAERQKKAKNKSAQKKFNFRYLFNGEEDYDPDDEMNKPVEGKPLLDDYNDEKDADVIFTEINSNFHTVFARTAILTGTTVASVILALLVQLTDIFGTSVRNGWLWYGIISFLLFSVSVVTARMPIMNGLYSLRRFKGNCDTAVAVASIAVAIQSICSLFTPNVFVSGTLHIYVPLVLLALMLNSLGKLMIIIRTHNNFGYLVKPLPKYAGKIFTDIPNAQKMVSELPSKKTIIGYTKRSKFMNNFLQLSYAPDPSEEIAAKVAPITTVLSLLCGLIYGIVTKSFICGTSSFALTACMSVPVICLLAVNIPLRRLCRNSLKSGAMVTSYETVKQFCDTNAIMIDSSQLYPKGSVILSGMKAFKQSKLNDAILSGAAVMYAVNGTMIHIFENIVQCSRDMLPKVENVIYEDGKGLVGWVKGQRVLIGSRELLMAHNITPPDISVEKRYTDIGNDVTYISVSGDLIAMFILSYKTDRKIANELQSLENNGVSFVIRTVDANLTREKIAERFGLYHRCITILPTGLGNICRDAMFKVDDTSRAYLVTRGKLYSFAKAVSGCIRMKSNVTISRILQYVAIALGLIIVTLISFVSGFEKLGCMEMLIYIGFWAITTILVTVIRK